jgi:DNA-binding XRE family transcriptional regulator
MPNKLALARKMLRISQETLAAAATTTQPTVSDAENGAALKLETAQRIAAVLGASVDDIFPLTEAPVVVGRSRTDDEPSAVAVQTKPGE